MCSQKKPQPLNTPFCNNFGSEASGAGAGNMKCEMSNSWAKDVFLFDNGKILTNPLLFVS